MIAPLHCRTPILISSRGPAAAHPLLAALALLAADDCQRRWRDSRRYAQPPDLTWDPQHWR